MQQHSLSTDALIETLSADQAREPQLPSILGWAVCAALAAGALAFMLLLEPRPHFVADLSSLRFDFKFVFAVTLLITSYAVLRRAMRPEMGDRPLGSLLLVVPAMLAAGVASEMLTVAPQLWASRWIGHNWLFCMTFVPILSLAPLAVLVLALSRGATTAPRRTGALAGLVAGAIGALFYAAHCPDDSPFFLATWYPVGIALVAGLGSAAGQRWLRW